MTEAFQYVEGKTHPGYSLVTFDEERAFRDEHWKPQKGDVCIDAGAAYGAYTLPALHAGATVYAFEPVPDVRADLVLNISLNGWLDRGEAFELALWDKAGPLEICDYAPHWPRETTGKYPVGSTGPAMGIRLDDWAHAQKLDRLDWMKIDVEGAEEHVIRGGIETIERFRPRLIVECHVFLDEKLPEKIRAMLPGYSFVEYPRDPCVMLVGRAA